MKFDWKNTQYTTSRADTPFPVFKDSSGNILPEIAFCGRSNVGKSSLLNDLCETTLARASKVPGKTQLLHFFSTSDSCILVDLPGYGFAKVPASMKKDWGKSLQKYFSSRSSLLLVLILIDVRRSLSEEDLQMIYWAKKSNKKTIVVLTKMDKVSSKEKEQKIKDLTAAINDSDISIIAYSIKTQIGRKHLRDCIRKELNI